MKKNYLVTGGSGFLGYNIIKTLIKNHNVTVLDNHFRGSQKKFLKIKKRIKIINCDIRNLKKVEHKLKNIDVVIHLAYINGTEFFYSKPAEVLDVGVKGLVNVLDFCIKKKIKELYLASSSEVYHQPEKVPTKENEAILKIPDVYNPRYSYAGGKIITELAGVHYGKKYFKKLIIFRPHNVYGEDMGSEHVIPQFIKRMKKLKKKRDFFIRSTGNEVRSFIYIDDFVKAFDILIKRGRHLQIYNIGNPEKIKIKNLAKKIAKIMKKKIKIKKSKKNFKGGTDMRCPDISKLKKIGFKPEVGLTEGLSRTIRWYS